MATDRSETAETRVVVEHPSHRARIIRVAEEFQRQRDLHRIASDWQWLGRLMSFSDEDLALVRELGYLSQNDENLLKERRPRYIEAEGRSAADVKPRDPFGRE
jgi:hypothetical protein